MCCTGPGRSPGLSAIENFSPTFPARTAVASFARPHSRTEQEVAVTDPHLLGTTPRRLTRLNDGIEASGVVRRCDRIRRLDERLARPLRSTDQWTVAISYLCVSGSSAGNNRPNFVILGAHLDRVMLALATGPGSLVNRTRTPVATAVAVDSRLVRARSAPLNDAPSPLGDRCSWRRPPATDGEIRVRRRARKAIT